jgi:hypothetical protein
MVCSRLSQIAQPTANRSIRAKRAGCVTMVKKMTDYIEQEIDNLKSDSLGYSAPRWWVQRVAIDQAWFTGTETNHLFYLPALRCHEQRVCHCHELPLLNANIPIITAVSWFSCCVPWIVQWKLSVTVLIRLRRSITTGRYNALAAKASEVYELGQQTVLPTEKKVVKLGQSKAYVDSFAAIIDKAKTILLDNLPTRWSIAVLPETWLNGLPHCAYSFSSQCWVQYSTNKKNNVRCWWRGARTNICGTQYNNPILI